MAGPSRCRAARALASLCALLMAIGGCDAFSDESGGDGELFPEPAFGVAGFAGVFISDQPPIGGAAGVGLGGTPTTGGTVATGGVSGGGTPPRDAGTRPSSCPENPPGCEVLIAGTLASGQACLFELVGLRVDADQACRGEVVLGGQHLSCGDDDGWTVTADGAFLLLLGAACDEYQQEMPALDAAFPCDAACRTGDGALDAGSADDDGGVP